MALCTVIILEAISSKELVEIKEKTYINNNNKSYTTYISDASYWQNVFFSEQCKGWEIEEMSRFWLPSKTGSMRPYVFSGDSLLTVPYQPNRKLVLGDVVANSGILHRIVAINEKENWYNMKGDNNENLDSKRYLFNETDYIVCGVMRGTI